MSAGARAGATPLIVVQARMGSGRLPGKVLMDLAGQPLLTWLLDRVEPSRLTSGTVVATSVLAADDAIADLCDKLGVDVVRGDEMDVLSRLLKAVDAAGAADLVRLSADSPLLDAEMVDLMVEKYRSGDDDLLENVSSPGWPHGTAVEVLSSEFLRRLDGDSSTAFEREHVTQAAYDHRERYRVRYIAPPAEWRSSMDLCVDTSADLMRVRGICEALGGDRRAGLVDVLAVARNLCAEAESVESP